MKTSLSKKSLFKQDIDSKPAQNATEQALPVLLLESLERGSRLRAL
jgi:hypothetical protein